MKSVSKNYYEYRLFLSLIRQGLMNTQVRAISVLEPDFCYLNDLMKESAIPRPFMVWRPPATPFFFFTYVYMFYPLTIPVILGWEKFGVGFGVSVNKT